MKNLVRLGQTKWSFISRNRDNNVFTRIHINKGGYDFTVLKLLYISIQQKGLYTNGTEITNRKLLHTSTSLIRRIRL